jgi:hypothetical protein
MMQVNIFDILASSNNRDRQAWIEARAKIAYDALIGTAGPPFANLPAHTIVGWKRVVEALDKEPRCWKCGAGMICLKCKEQTE